MRPRPPLSCRECGHRLHAKVSPAGLRYLAHDANAPRCASAGESVAHHLLKLELALAAWSAGWTAELEVSGPDGSWRADVSASSPDGSRRIAWEAQLSAITPDRIVERTGNLARHGLQACWASPDPRPRWLGAVPSIRVASPEGGAPWRVLDGVARFAGRGWSVVERTALTDFVRWVAEGRVLPHQARTAVWGWRHGEGPPLRTPTVWTSTVYVQAEQEHLDGLVRQEQRLAAARERAEQRRAIHRAEIHQKNLVSRSEAVKRAIELEGQMRETRFREATRNSATRQKTLTVGWSVREPCWAYAVPLFEGANVPVAVFNPSRVHVRGEAYRLLAGLLLLFPNDAQRRLFLQNKYRAPDDPAGGWQTEVITASEVVINASAVDRNWT